MDYENSKDYTLSIRLMPDGFSFSIHNVLVEHSYRYEYIHFGTSANYWAALEENIFRQEILLYPYRQVEVVVASQRFTLIPAELYNSETGDLLYNFAHIGKRDKILTDRLEHTNAFNVYGIEEEVYDFLCRTFTNLTFHHHQSILIEYFTIKSKMGNSDKMICQLRHRMLDVVCFSKGNLRLANSFEYEHVNDAAYYILAAWESLRMNFQTDSLQLTGNSEEVAVLSSLLNPYIGQIIPVVFPAQMFNLGEESLQAPFDLIVLPLCV